MRTIRQRAVSKSLAVFLASALLPAPAAFAGGLRATERRGSEDEVAKKALVDREVRASDAERPGKAAETVGEGHALVSDKGAKFGKNVALALGVTTVAAEALAPHQAAAQGRVVIVQDYNPNVYYGRQPVQQMPQVMQAPGFAGPSGAPSMDQAIVGVDRTLHSLSSQLPSARTITEVGRQTLDHPVATWNHAYEAAPLVTLAVTGVVAWKLAKRFLSPTRMAERNQLRAANAQASAQIAQARAQERGFGKQESDQSAELAHRRREIKVADHNLARQDRSGQRHEDQEINAMAAADTESRREAALRRALGR